MKKLILAACALVTVLPVMGEDPEWSLEDLRIVGVDLGLRWGAQQLIIGGGWELGGVGRDLETGRPLGASEGSSDVTVPDLRLIDKWTWSQGEADLWAAAGVWGHGNFGLGSGGTGAFPDLPGGLMGFVRAGLTRDRMTRNAHGVRFGSRIDALVEAGPAFLSLRGTEYFRAEFQSSVLLPLWDWEGPGHLFSGVLGLRANALWTDGRSVPVLLILPTEVRGYRGAFDTRFRSVATSELRVGLPSLAGPSDLVPVVLVYSEGGWYTGYANGPANAADRSGWLASVGAGFGMTFFGAVTPTLTVGVPLTAESGLWWAINSNLRF